MIHARPVDRSLQALPLAMAAALLSLVSETPVASIVVAPFIVLALVVGGRRDFSMFTQWTVAAFAAAVGGVLMATLAPTGDAAGRVDRFWSVIAAAAVFGGASRLFARNPHGGARVTFGVGFVAIAVAAETRVRGPYWLFAALWLVAALAALRSDDPARPRWFHAGRGPLMGTVVLLTLSAIVGFGAAHALVPLHARVSAYILGRISQSDTVTGFTGSLELSGLDGMLQSDTVVLRAYGPVDDYLRGAVYDRYDRVGWLGMEASAVSPVVTRTGPLVGPPVVEIRRVSGLAGRFFLPLGLREIATARGVAGVDPYGIAHVAPGDLGDVVWYRPGTRRQYAPAPPSDNDLRVPPDVRAALTPLVTQWTGEATGPAHVVADLTAHLRRDYHYSFHVPAPRRRTDPVVDFLFRHRQGHCEYFASALALLCRTAGIPARVVGGYRVSERNAFGGYMVVRERNAHTWVEAWLPGHGWTTLDATPGGGEPRVQNASTWRALVELGAAFADASGAWLARRRPVDLLAVAAVFGLALAFVRWFRARRDRVADVLVAGDKPLPEFVVLTNALARSRIERQHAEALEHFAERLTLVLPADVGRTVSDAVLHYAALRYGAEGDPLQVAFELAQAAEAVRRRTPHVTLTSDRPPRDASG